MNQFNFKSAVCTSRSQSKRLLALGLKRETADCNLNNYSLKGKNYQDDWQVGTVPYSDCLESWRAFAKDSCWELIPAWSLHRLLLLIPKEVNIDGFRFPLRSDAVMRLGEADDMYEYTIGVLERTIKEGYYPKEYLEE